MRTPVLETAKYIRETQKHEVTQEKRQSRFRVLGWLAIAAGIGFAVWNFYSAGDFFAATATLVVGVGAVNGFRRGFLGIVISLVALVVATQFALPIGKGIESLFSERLGTQGILNRGVAVVATGTLIYLSFSLFVSSMLWVILGNREKPLLFGRLLGMTFGIVQWGLAVAVFLGGLILLEPSLQHAQAPAISSRFTQQIGATSLRPLVEWCNPILMVPELDLEPVQELNNTFATLSDPAQIQELLSHRSIQDLRKDPRLDQVLEKIWDDPDVIKLLQSQKPISPSLIAPLLQNDTILMLLDQPKFIGAAQQWIAERHAAPTSETTP